MLRSVWVDFIHFDCVDLATLYVSRQLKFKVAPWQVQAAMDHNYPIGGMWIRDTKPDPGVEFPPLLRYPRGESNLERGLPGVAA